MAGRPIRRGMIAALEKLAAEAELSDVDFVCRRIADGDSFTKMASELNVSRAMLSSYCNGLSEDAKRALESAQEEQSHAFVERTRDIVEAAGPTREDVARAKLQSDLLLWIAARAHSRHYGDRSMQPQVNVNIAAGSLMLDSLRRRQVMIPIAAVTRLLGSGDE